MIQIVEIVEPALFLGASSISFYIDRHRGCNDVKLFIHHCLSIFLHFGWLSSDPLILKLYLMVPLITMVHWLLNRNRCMATEQYNIECNLPKDEPFNDIINLVGLKRYSWWNNVGHYVYLILAFMIAVFKSNGFYRFKG